MIRTRMLTMTRLLTTMESAAKKRRVKVMPARKLKKRMKMKRRREKKKRRMKILVRMWRRLTPMTKEWLPR